MSAKTSALEVLPTLTPEIGKRVERIKTYHEGTLRAFSDQMGYAFLSGVELLALKETCDGDFIKVCQSELPQLSNGARGRYMAFTKALIEKFPTVGNLAKQPLLITNGRIEAEASKQICKAVHDVADGKTLTEMYRDLGVIRQPKKQVHTAPRDLTPDEELAARNEQHTALFNDVRISIEMLLDEEHPDSPLINPDVSKARAAAIAACHRFTRACAEAKSRKRKTR
jgi:hypothetical protein